MAFFRYSPGEHPVHFLNTLLKYFSSWKPTISVFLHSLAVTGLSVIGLVIVSSMTAYRIVRRPTRFNRLLFTAFVEAMIIPFQSVMLPLMRITWAFELRGELYGIVICYLGFGISLSMFLFHGFIKTVPQEIEVAAVVDGWRSPIAA